jgi:hypothetical protein
MMAIITIIKRAPDRDGRRRQLMGSMALEAIYCHSGVVGIYLGHVQIGVGLDLIAVDIHKIRGFFLQVFVGGPMTE